MGGRYLASEIMNDLIFSSIFYETPEAMFRMDRIANFNRGRHGDIELYNDPVLLIRRELQARVEDQILNGSR